MCHLDLACRPEELLTLAVRDFVRDVWGMKVEMQRSKTKRRSIPLQHHLQSFTKTWFGGENMKKQRKLVYNGSHS